MRKIDDTEAAKLYGANAREWLERWDEGERPVWSVEMGGLGPGYEQCIQITAAEILRWLIEHIPNIEDGEWAKSGSPMNKEVSAIVRPLGLSGAQWGAALNLAAMFYKQGPANALRDERVADRLIQVMKNFPSLEKAEAK
jgi:hypothetical protein